MGVIPPSLDQLVAGDVQRTRLKDIKALLFIGANDAYLPGALLRTGLLSERDRERFLKEKINLASGCLSISAMFLPTGRVCAWNI